MDEKRGVTLRFIAEPSGTGSYDIKLTAMETGSGKILKETDAKVSATDMTGNIALQSHFNNGQEALKDKPGFWEASGARLVYHPERCFGPWLPTLEITGTALPPVVKITYEGTGELVYAIRIRGNSFRPKVFAKGVYKIEAGEPGTDKWKILENVSSVIENNTEKIKIEF